MLYKQICPISVIFIFPFLKVNFLVFRRLAEEELRNKSASLTRAQPVKRPPGSQQSLPTVGHLNSQQNQPVVGQTGKQYAEPTLLKDRIKKLQVDILIKLSATPPRGL